MHPDVQALRDFYYRSALGRAARGALRDQVLRFWPEAQGLNVGGYGFAVPVLRPYLAQARRVMALMPAPQGVMRWPAGMPNVSVLAEEMLWPVETGHLDRLVVMHGLETCTNVTADYGVAVIGTSDQGSQTLYDIDLRRPLVLLMGREETGLSKGIAARCDELVKLPMKGTVSSLNVSVATGVCLYEILRQRR